MIKTVNKILLLALIAFVSIQAVVYSGITNGPRFNAGRYLHYDVVAQFEDTTYAGRVKLGSLFVPRTDVYISKMVDLQPEEQELIQFEGLNLFQGDQLNFFELDGNIYAEAIRLLFDETSLEIKRINRSDLNLSETFEAYRIKHNKSVRNKEGDILSASSRFKKYRAYAIRPVQEKDEQCIITLQLYSGDMELVWEEALQTGVNGRLCQLQSLSVSETGDVALTIKSYKEKNRESLRGVSNYNFKLFTYGNEKGLEHDIVLDGLYMSEFDLLYDRNGVLNGMGYYGIDQFHSDGIYSVRVNSDQQLTSENFAAFEYEFLSIGLNYTQANRLNRRLKSNRSGFLENIRIRALVEQEDGHILVGEHYFRAERTYVDAQGNTTYKTQFYYGDILVNKIDQHGNLLWGRKIPKHQDTYNDNGRLSSVAVAHAKDSILLIFNDNPRNVNLEEGQIPRHVRFHRRALVPMQIIIDNAGNMSKQIMENDYKRSRVIYAPRDMRFINEQHLFMPAASSNYKYLRYSKMDLLN